MFRHVFSVSALALIVGCNGTNPFFDTEASIPDVIGDVELPPEVVQPPEAVPGSISRYEERNDAGGGYAESIKYNGSTFEVDNLAFDGLNIYNLSTLSMGTGSAGEVGGYKLFTADVQVEDYLTHEPVGQIVPYHAIYGESTVTLSSGEPRSRFAIVRTGGYDDYGFGGFIYERNGTVVLPEIITGQAGFSGRYAGMRVFTGLGALEFTEGNLEISIDFDDFNETHAIKGLLSNRVAFDESGTVIDLTTDGLDDTLVLPNLHFVIESNVDTLTANGEIAGKVHSSYIDFEGTSKDYENGYYFGIIAGDTTAGDGGELVGILVFESSDPRYENVRAQETGGFILLRN